MVINFLYRDDVKSLGLLTQNRLPTRGSRGFSLAVPYARHSAPWLP